MQPKGLLKFLRLEGFAQNVKEYVENQIAITKLEAKQKVADIGSTVAALVPAALFGFFALIFLSLTLAMAINVWLDSLVWGFLIVGVLYLVGAGVMFSMRDSVWLKKKIVDGSTKFLKEKPQQEKDQQEKDNANAKQTSPVEHKKVIFEDLDEDGEVITADRERYTTTAERQPHVAADREPLSKATAVTEVRTNHNAAIIETETEEDTKREERS
ncbi:phage holin family protein [Cesiribacter sp. SM1]|uniref:phage holin family protein n=1 Tax=Cesiribacter sp. SM1 TaxID=2861196 RepID=UPI001CD2AF54